MQMDTNTDYLVRCSNLSFSSQYNAKMVERVATLTLFRRLMDRHCDVLYSRREHEIDDDNTKIFTNCAWKV